MKPPYWRKRVDVSKTSQTHSVRHVYDINLGDSRAAFIDSLGAALHISDHRITTCKRCVTSSFEK